MAGKTQHGMVGTPTYSSWQGLKQRCLNPKNIAFADYGGRGIRVCKRWLKFENFFADMGERPPGTSIDRIKVNGHYTPSNCRWATNAEQKRNTRRSRFVEHNGKRQCVQDWSAEIGVSVPALIRRLNSGDPTALDRPPTPRAALYTHGGLTLTLVEWGERTGVDWRTIGSRLRRGWTLADALSQPMMKARRPESMDDPRVKYIEHSGERRSIVEWARRIGITSAALQSRLKKWPVKRALTEPPWNRGPRTS